MAPSQAKKLPWNGKKSKKNKHQKSAASASRRAPGPREIERAMNLTALVIASGYKGLYLPDRSEKLSSRRAKRLRKQIRQKTKYRGEIPRLVFVRRPAAEPKEAPNAERAAA